MNLHVKHFRSDWFLFAEQERKRHSHINVTILMCVLFVVSLLSTFLFLLNVAEFCAELRSFFSLNEYTICNVCMEFCVNCLNNAKKWHEMQRRMAMSDKIRQVQCGYYMRMGCILMQQMSKTSNMFHAFTFYLIHSSENGSSSNSFSPPERIGRTLFAFNCRISFGKIKPQTWCYYLCTKIKE